MSNVTGMRIEVTADGWVTLRNNGGFICLNPEEVEQFKTSFIKAAVSEGFVKQVTPVKPSGNAVKYPHYFKELPEGTTHIDVYMVLDLFGVTSQWIGHSIKKLLCPGQRHDKDFTQDVTEARNTLNRGLEIESLKRKGDTGE